MSSGAHFSPEDRLTLGARLWERAYRTELYQALKKLYPLSNQVSYPAVKSTIFESFPFEIIRGMVAENK